MQKVRIVSLEQDKPKVVAALHMMGALDLRKSGLELGDDRPAANSTEVSDSLVKVDGALRMLTPQSVKHENHLRAERLVAEVKRARVLGEVYDLGGEKKLLEDDQKALDYADHIAGALSDVRMDLGRTKSDYLSYRAFETDGKGGGQLGRMAGGRQGGGMELFIHKFGKDKQIAFLAYDKKRNIDDMLKGIRLNELDLSAKYLEGSPKEVLRVTAKKRRENVARLAAISRRMAEISRVNYSHLSNLKEMLEIELERSEVSSSFKRTESTFIIEGWVQKRQAEELRQGIAGVTKGRMHFEELRSDELAPTHTRRPKFLQPFDYLVSFYSVQRSDEIDPTWIFILSFPIFYGLMVTDVGYGVASLILASLIVTKTDADGLMYNAARIWQLNSFAAMFFGILSNQWFGFQLPYSTPFSFDWLKNTPELIAITVLFGVVQVILGLAIGVINSNHHGHRKMAYARLASILVVFFGTLAVAGAFFGAFNATITEISGAIAVVSLLLAAALSGSEATEILNLITHPLSYARLMGFGGERDNSVPDRHGFHAAPQQRCTHLRGLPSHIYSFTLP